MAPNVRAGTHDGYEYVVALEPRGGTGDDRAVVVHVASGIVIALADGAGGTSHGADAAETVIRAVETTADREPKMLLYELDSLGMSGQTTAVIASVGRECVVGASVGDSGAWLIGATGIIDLTRSQVRKPLLGDGCTPVAFSNEFLSDSTLLVASDGLLRYAKGSDIARVVQQPTLEGAARDLVDLVRLPSGERQDDISIVLCRRAR